jgi:hypothetical protein
VTLHPRRQQLARRAFRDGSLPARVTTSRMKALTRNGLPEHDYSALLNPRPAPPVAHSEPAAGDECAEMAAQAAAAGRHECGYPAGSRSCAAVCGQV